MENNALKFSLAKRFNLTIVCTLAVIFLAFSIGVVIYSNQKMQTELEQKADMAAEVVKKGLASSIWLDDDRYVNEALGTLCIDPEVVYASLESENTSIFQSQPEFIGHDLAYFHQPDYFIKTLQIQNAGENIGTLQIVISKRERKQVLVNTIVGIILLFFICFGSLSVIILMLSRRYIFTPLKEIEKVTAAIAAGDMSVQIAVRSKDEIGKLAGSIGKMKDSITQYIVKIKEAESKYSRLLEERLQLAEKKYKDIFESIPIGIFRASPYGYYLAANPYAARIIGYESPDELYRSVTDIASQIFASPQDGKDFRQLMAEGRKADNFEVRLRQKDGIASWCLLSPVPTRDSQGNIIYYECVIQDIHDRKTAEENLRLNQANFRALFDLSLDMLFVLDEGGAIIRSNRSASERLGYPEEKLRGLSIVSLHPEEQREEALQFILRAASGSQETCNIPLKAKDGSLVFVQTQSVQGMWDEKPALFINSKDITELALSEDKFSKAFDTSPILLSISTLDEGRFVDVNRSFLSTLGYAREEVIGRTFSELSLFEATTQYDNIVGTLMETGALRQLIVVIRDRNGRNLICEFNAQLIGITGKSHMLAVVTDITERTESQLQLKILSDRLQLAIQTANAGIWSWDIVNNELSWDERMFHLSGIPPEPFGRNSQFWQKVIHPDDLPALLRAMQRAIRGKADFNHECRLIWPDGSIRHIKGNAAVQRDDRGSPVYMVGMSWDITEYRQALEAAQQANRIKSQFVANMSHEIRTPLTGVLGITSLLADTSLTDRQRNYVEKIKSSGESLLSIINDILDFSKIEAGKMVLESIPFSLQKIFRETDSIFGYQVANKGIDFRMHIDEAIPPLLIGDPQRIKQIINNLMSNAVKFTPAGSIELSASARKGGAGELTVEVSVKDTGIGISQEEQLRLFEAFSQADSSTTRRFGGSGLGLAISKQLVELMRGTIRLESTPGQGSVFNFVIPFRIAPEGTLTDTAPRAGDDYHFVDVKALLVEDNEIIQDIISAAMCNMGIAVETAKNGREALEMVGCNDYDIVLMDIQMPEMDGLETTRRIRVLPKKDIGRLPILALTAHGLGGDRERSLMAGMNDHLTKPVDQHVLKDALRRWLPPGKCRTAPAREVKVVRDKERLHTPAPCLDMAAGLRNVGGDQAFYIKTLGDFVVRYGDTASRLMEELNAGLLADAVCRIHALKGVAGYLGGRELQAAAAELEKQLRAAESGERAPLERQVRIFAEHHRTFLEEVVAILDRQAASVPIPEEGPGTEKELIELLSLLRESLENSTPKSCREAMNRLLQKRWPRVDHQELTELNLLVARYRYAEARGLLDKIFGDIVR
ncbi:MAG: PAS domain S-box protein [Syntrophaceae bacterium]